MSSGLELRARPLYRHERWRVNVKGISRVYSKPEAQSINAWDKAHGGAARWTQGDPCVHSRPAKWFTRLALVGCNFRDQPFMTAWVCSTCNCGPGLPSFGLYFS